MALEFSNILTIIILILIVFPVIYLIYIMLPKNKHSKEIYQKPPTKDPPAFVNSLFGSGINKMVGEINIGSFYLTLLDLINRKYVSVRITTKKDQHNQHNQHKTTNERIKKSESREKTLDKIILKINEKSTDKLHPFEKNVLRCIHSLENKGNINILDTKEALTKRLKVNSFQKNYDNWIKNFHEEFFKDNKSELFNNNFDNLKIYGALLGVIFIITSIFSYFENSNLNLILSFIMGAFGFFLVFVPIKKLGGWTKEGEELEQKWNSFKKFYTENFKSTDKSQKFLNEGINYLPYLYAMGISKSVLVKNFSDSNKVTDTYVFLKYNTDSIIKEIVKDFLAADGTFDPKFYNTSGNFVPGFGL
ncbi:DUF2207 domain-containing protein [Methanobrevibacter sp. TMH8]|uniref:DUF2207 family protein n=1 Tax=Methanobrevibacter sp. TMH8 TaxID=2848611 RepID=UPI001CCF04DF|nr:DUF2207 domain-containing protein [Methanobrevibacter sp. TMH8]MBZ9571649.1 DUF2207 domain-containing protein [Methanobrevibacter sp. TMH8]